MAEVIGILTGLLAAGQALESFAQQTRKWKRLSDRLFDIREGLDCAQLALERWKRMFDIEKREEHRIYLKVLFGNEGCTRITATLASIEAVTQTLQGDVSRLVGRALKVRSDQESFGIEECLQRIRQNSSLSQKFALTALGKADEMERRLERLDKKVGVLERFTDLYLEREHPGIFEEIRRLPGRRVILKVGDGGTDGLGKHLRNSMAAREDAQLLHQASGKGNTVHIGLSVPQIDDRDFDFLLNVDGQTHEILVHPVKIKAINNSSRVKSDFTAAVSALMRNPRDALYVLPSKAGSAGFEVNIPLTSHLVDLEHKESLASIIKHGDKNLGSQILYPQDQSAIASGLAQGSLRLIGSQWLSFLDCSNVRWRRTRDGQWTSMLTAAPGNLSITRTLEKCLSANRTRRERRDLTKHIQIFRIGLVLAELSLKTPISYIDFDPVLNAVELYINDGEKVYAADIAEAVERESNRYLGNIVFYCLNVLQNQDKMRERTIEADYFKEVIRDAKELDGLLTKDGRRGDKSPGGASVGAGK